MADKFNIYEYYKFHPMDGSGDIIVRRGEGAPKMVSGGARWKTVNRPKRQSIVLYDGSDPYRMEVPIIIDGWKDELGIEYLIARINQLRMPAGDRSPSTKLRITGAVPVKGATWVVENLDWGDNVIWHAQGEKSWRYRQDGVLHLLQFVPEQALTGLKRPGPPAKIVITKAGQGIHDLALGNTKNKKAIQKANGIRDPKTVGKTPGKTYKVPIPKLEPGPHAAPPNLEPGPQVRAVPAPKKQSDPFGWIGKIF